MAGWKGWVLGPWTTTRIRSGGSEFDADPTQPHGSATSMAMAQAPAPPPAQVEGDAPPPMTQLSIEAAPKAVVPHDATAGALVAAERPATEKLVTEQELSKPEKKSRAKVELGKRGSNLKAEAFAVAHSKRVEHEAQAFIDSEVRKAEAQAEKQKAIAEKELMREEATATEQLKKEEQRAELVVHTAELKADKIVAQAKEKSVLIKANAKEVAEKHIAEAITACEREKAAADEAKAKRMAEIKDKAETMIASGELIASDHKGFGQKVKENLICH